MLDVPPDREMAQVCKSGHTSRVQELLAWGVPGDGGLGGRTFLSIACEHGRAEVITVLLRAGAPANGRDFILAARSGVVPAARRMLDELQLMQLPFDFWAAERPLLTEPEFLRGTNAEMIRFLLDNGADPTEVDRNGRAALEAARRAGASPE
ncbi:MAG: ankyrin repeat domain-containing protein, partial [Myxococcota bacterium]